MVIKKKKPEKKNVPSGCQHKFYTERAKIQDHENFNYRHKFSRCNQATEKYNMITHRAAWKKLSL